MTLLNMTPIHHHSQSGPSLILFIHSHLSPYLTPIPQDTTITVCFLRTFVFLQNDIVLCICVLI